MREEQLFVEVDDSEHAADGTSGVAADADADAERKVTNRKVWLRHCPARSVCFSCVGSNADVQSLVHELRALHSHDWDADTAAFGSEQPAAVRYSAISMRAMKI